MGIRKIPEEKQWFHFHNANPKNARTDDCVFRAISTVTGISWDDVVMGLAKTAVKLKRSLDDTKVIDSYLGELGYVRRMQPYRIELYTEKKEKYTGQDFCQTFRSKTCIANIGGHHMTAIVNGKIYDTWDCSEGCIGNYWEKVR